MRYQGGMPWWVIMVLCDVDVRLGTGARYGNGEDGVNILIMCLHAFLRTPQVV
jgi:hypothetical protein